MNTPFKTLNAISVLLITLGSIFLLAGLLGLIILGVVVFFPKSLEPIPSKELLTTFYLALLSGGGVIIGITLLAQGEFIRLMLAIEDHLDEHTDLLRRLLRTTIKNERD